MNDSHDLDGLYAQLRSPATPDELAHESDVVDLMARAHLATTTSTTSEGKPMRSTSRRSRVAVLLAAGVIGFGGVAAAGPGTFEIASIDTVDPNDTGTTTTSTTTSSVPTGNDDGSTTTSSEVTTTSIEDGEGTGVVIPTTDGGDAGDDGGDGDEPVVYGELDDPNEDTAFNEAYCLEGNHGKTVSAVARGEDPFADVEVRDAAHSTCGKDDGSDDDEDSDELEDGSDESDDDHESDDDADDGDDADDSDADDSDADDDGKQGPPDHAKGGDKDDRPGKSNGNGKGGKKDK